MDNIRYGKMHAMDEEVIHAAKKTDVHEFSTTLSQGYTSLLGERGIKLSGGQRQRIAIAQMVLKNAPILIMDEPNSHLDAITEKTLEEPLQALMKGKTALVISHSLSTLLHMDRILVFEKGRIVGDGTHQELLKKDGVYKKLWETQSNKFSPTYLCGNR